MLTILFKDEEKKIDQNLKIIRDVEEAFKKTKLTGTKKEKALIELIDEGKYENSFSFIDRFGFKLYISELSTGCKCALVVQNNPDAVVDIRECGFNARNAIISVCRQGTILIENDGVSYNLLDGTHDIEVRVDNYVFSDIDRLNTYINDERPFGILQGWNGVQELKP